MIIILLPLLFWVERNMALPGIGSFLSAHGAGLPWIYLEGGMAWSIAWNLALLGTLGFLLARGVHRIFIGVFSLLIIAFWQPTGVMLYQLIPSAVYSSLLSFVLFWGLMALAVKRKQYVLAAAACFLTPMLGLDRLIFGLGVLGYLTYSAKVRSTESIP